MKYFRVFIAVVFFFILAAIPLMYMTKLPNEVLSSTNSMFIYFLLFNFPIILTTLSAIVFFVFLIKYRVDRNLYWSNFFLALAVNFTITLLVDVPVRVTQHYKWINVLEKGSNFFYKITGGRIAGWFLTFIAIIGFICLFLYFKSKYKNKTTVKLLAQNEH